MHNNPCVAALPQLDRGSDYESERHRFESYTPHQLKSKASGNGGFSFTSAYYQHWYYLTSVIVPFLIGLYIIKKIIECAKIVDMRETEYRTIKETYEQNTGVN